MDYNIGLVVPHLNIRQSFFPEPSSLIFGAKLKKFTIVHSSKTE
jgi:hypothetical protein